MCDSLAAPFVVDVTPLPLASCRPHPRPAWWVDGQQRLALADARLALCARGAWKHARCCELGNVLPCCGVH